MTTHSDGRTLPWRFLGRAVRPYALADRLRRPGPTSAIRDAEV